MEEQNNQNFETQKSEVIVEENFIREYERGRTPNPCVVCNSEVKFIYLLRYAEENGFIVSNDTGLIDKVIKEAIAADPKAVADFKGGKEKALMALFGKCMKQLKGNCDPQVLRTMLIDEINKA